MQLDFDLGEPNLTLLHRAGIAGLWMTLRQLEREDNQVENRPGGLNWELAEDERQSVHRRITLRWEGNDRDVLDWLLRESFQISDEGLISLRGLNSKTMDIQSRLIVHQGILGTFLQHNSTHKSAGTASMSFLIDETEFSVTFKALTSYVYQDFVSNLCNKQGRLLKKPVSVAGWLNPGAVVRHVAFSADTSFEEPLEQAFVLLFAPVACYYYILRSKLRDKRAQYALVVPEVTDLEVYARYRQQPQLINAGYKDFYASGLGDAGLRFLTYETTAETAKTYKVQRCQVLTLGTVAWSTQQKTRTDLYMVEADAQICENYQVCCNHLSDRVMVGKQGGFVASSFARELIAENLAKFRPWYIGISEKVNSNDSFKQLTYERGGLHEMVHKVKWDADSEKLFIQACHEAIRFMYGQLAEQAKDRKEKPNFDRINVKIRTGLSRCKNADTFREFITDFWSRAGRIPTLQEHWSELMELITGRSNWKVARDLALLALASYKGKGITDSEEDSDTAGVDQEEDEDLID